MEASSLRIANSSPLILPRLLRHLEHLGQLGPPWVYRESSRSASLAVLSLFFFSHFLSSTSLAQVPPPTRPDATPVEDIQGYVDDNHFKTSSNPSNLMEGANVELSSVMLFGKKSSTLVKSIDALTHQHKESIFKIVGEHRPATLGTVVSADGYLVAKLSELDEKFVCVRSTGQQYLANIIAKDHGRDLVLLQIAANDLQPIDLSTKAVVAVGDLLVSPGFDGEALGLGIVGIDSVKLDATDSTIRKKAVLGISVSSYIDSATIVDQGNQVIKSGVRVNRVEPRTAGEEFGILVGDLILGIDEKSITSSESWNQLTNGLAIGQELKLSFVRNGKLFTTTLRAKGESNRTVHDRWGGGPFSNRRFGLGKVIIHDTVIQPEDCGGPLVNLDGEVIGINIARTLRVSSFAIPNKEVSNFIRSAVPDLKLK